jgi:hypothetical protein
VNGRFWASAEARPATFSDRFSVFNPHGEGSLPIFANDGCGSEAEVQSSRKLPLNMAAELKDNSWPRLCKNANICASRKQFSTCAPVYYEIICPDNTVDYF